MRNYCLVVARCFFVLKYIEKEYFGSQSLLDDKFPFRGIYAALLVELARARAVKKDTSLRRLREVRQLVRGTCKLDQINRTGQQIIFLLSDTSNWLINGQV